MPVDWRTGLIFPVHKKGSKDTCENCIGSTFLPQMYKILSSVLHNRVVRYAEMTIGDYQNGRRSGQGTTDNIFIFRQIIEKAYEYNIYIYMFYL
jgi:hypothetical protein